jgi:uncharacterized protein (DUF1330 family)
MKKGYWVNVYRSISDESALKAYGALALQAVEAFGGRFSDQVEQRLHCFNRPRAGDNVRTGVSLLGSHIP